MTSREELIEEAAKAILYWNNKDQPGVDFPADIDDARTIAGVALAVFEKAHAPTDDVREATAEEVEAMRRVIARGSYSTPYQDAADRLTQAGFGFRRSEGAPVGVVAEKPEWEYRVRDSVRWHKTEAEAREESNARRSHEIVQRRRKAGPWVPVKQEGGD